ACSPSFGIAWGCSDMTESMCRKAHRHADRPIVGASAGDVTDARRLFADQCKRCAESLLSAAAMKRKAIALRPTSQATGRVAPTVGCRHIDGVLRARGPSRWILNQAQHKVLTCNQ